MTYLSSKSLLLAVKRQKWGDNEDPWIFREGAWQRTRGHGLISAAS